MPFAYDIYPKLTQKYLFEMSQPKPFYKGLSPAINHVVELTSGVVVPHVNVFEVDPYLQ
jgi:hypothetical protein